MHATDTQIAATGATGSVSINTQGADLDGYGGINAASDVIIVHQDCDVVFTSSFAEGYDHASTPWIESQFTTGNHPNKVAKQLFKFHSLVDGEQTNTTVKVSVANIKEPADVDNIEQYSKFSIIVRKYGDTDKTPSILEQYNNCSLDPDSPNYIVRVIGDRYAQFDSTLNKVRIYGDYSNISNYIRVEVANQVAEKSYNAKLSPKGFGAMQNPISGGCFTPAVVIASASYKDQLLINSVYNNKAYLGWNFLSQDNKNFIKPLPQTTEGNVYGAFNVENFQAHPSGSNTWKGSLSAAIDTTGVNGPTKEELKFTVPFQGGSDGMRPSQVIRTGQYLTGNNAFGMEKSIRYSWKPR